MKAVINLFGPPGAGKSTTASDLFAHMKWNNLNVELVNEFAKEATWEKRHSILEDQLYVVAKQNAKLWRLKDQVDFAVSDSPLLLSQAYTKEEYFPVHFKNFVKELFDYYNNINILIKRVKPYHQVGRSQTEVESDVLGVEIKEMLDAGGYEYLEVEGTPDAKYEILDYVRSKC